MIDDGVEQLSPRVFHDLWEEMSQALPYRV